MSRIPGLYHRLALAFSILYLANGFFTLAIHDFSLRAFADGYQIAAMLAAALTVGLLLKLIPYTTRVDTTNPLSRVGKHFVYVGFASAVWLSPALLTPFGIVGSSKPTTVQCLADRFLSPRCIPLGLNAILPFAILGTLLAASYTMHERAIALHGEESIPLPAGIEHPANFWRKRYPPGHELPLWMLAHMADVELGEEAKTPVELV
ncbi:hypothetical protein B0H19DRAFT_291357 [Mycena capillaripes]|nr:hypothetical protein B0H19DRAFT_291357 [Mycena capillaripes]